MSDTISYLHAKMILEAKQHGVTVEDFARAWASLDNKLHQFDAEKGKRLSDCIWGTYQGYVTEMEEIFVRATEYARKRGGNG